MRANFSLMSSEDRQEKVSRLADLDGGKCSYSDELRSSNDANSARLSPEKRQMKSIRSPVHKQQRRNSNEKESGDSTGFFLTEAAENYGEDVFGDSNKSDKYGSSYDMYSGVEKGSRMALSPRESMSEQSKSKKISLRYEKEINDSMSRSINNLLSSQMNDLHYEEADNLSLGDDALSKLHKRLEEATALEYLIEQNQIRENVIVETMKRQTKITMRKPNSWINENLQRPLIVSKSLSKPRHSSSILIPNPRKKAWEDPLHNKAKYGNLRVDRSVLSCNNRHNSAKLNTLLGKLTKNKVFTSNTAVKLRTNKTFDNSELRRRTCGEDSIQYGLDGRVNRTKGNKKEKISSQLRGRIRSEKGAGKSGAKRSTFDSSYLPMIHERSKKGTQVPSPNRPQKTKSTFMTDFSGLEFDTNKGVDVIDQREKENLMGRKKRAIFELNEKIRYKFDRGGSSPRSNRNLRANSMTENARGEREGCKNEKGLGPSIPAILSRLGQDLDRSNTDIEAEKSKFKRATIRHQAYDKNKNVSYANNSDRKKSSLVRMTGISNARIIPTTSYAHQYMPPDSDKENRMKGLVHRPTDELINLLSQVERKEYGRQKAAKGDTAEGDSATAQLMKHAKRLGSHWAAAEFYATKYNSFEDED